MENNKEVKLDDHQVKGYNLGIEKQDLDKVYDIENPALTEEEKFFLAQMKERALKDLETPKEQRVSPAALHDKEIVKLRSKLGLDNETSEPTTVKKLIPDVPKPVQEVKNETIVSQQTKKIYTEETEVERDWGSSYDMVELPTRGKIYKGKPKRVKLSYLNGSDEDILTNQGLLESGLYLKHLIERKILDNNICYEDLSLGDRNAILLWLRATAYGNEYTFELQNPYKEDEVIEHTVDLSELPVTYLDEDTDEYGCFTRILPISGYEVKFRIYTIRDLNIAERLTEEKSDKLVSETLSNQIYSIDGVTDRNEIKSILSKLRIKDTRFIRDEMAKIEPGVDLELEIASGDERFKYPFPFDFDFLLFG